MIILIQELIDSVDRRIKGSINQSINVGQYLINIMRHQLKAKNCSTSLWCRKCIVLPLIRCSCPSLTRATLFDVSTLKGWGNIHDTTTGMEREICDHSQTAMKKNKQTKKCCLCKVVLFHCTCLFSCIVAKNLTLSLIGITTYHA